MLDWKKHKLESRLLGEISITSDMRPAGNLGKAPTLCGAGICLDVPEESPKPKPQRTLT